MASSVVTHAVLASPLNRTRFATSIFPSKYVPSLRRSAKMQVKCKAEGGREDESSLSELTPPPSKKVDPNFINLLSFAGPAPERINGRLAMIGFVSAIVVEMFSGQDLFTQIANGGFMWFVRTSILFTVASLIPFSMGVGPGATSDSFWNPNAEVWNGRAAMVGLVALALTEFVKGGALL